MERFWADVFSGFPQNDPDFELFFMMDKSTRGALKRIERLNRAGNIIPIVNYKGGPQVLKNFLDVVSFLFRLATRRINILQCVFYGPHYYKRLRYLSIVPRALRPKIVLTEVTSMTPYCVVDEEVERQYGLRNRFRDIYELVKVDAILTWYQFTKQVFIERKVVKSNPFIHAVRYCFADTSRFTVMPKKNVVVFAGRLVKVKRPLWFVNAVYWLKKNHPQLIAGWSFEIYGSGPLKNEVSDSIRQFGLESEVRMCESSTMYEVFGQSRIFVSTQDYENFTSLSMLEAMACGNVIVSRNVGQTSYFARHGENAFLAEEDTPEGLAMALKRAMDDPVRLDHMSKKSVEIATREHNVTNFLQELRTFWGTVDSL